MHDDTVVLAFALAALPMKKIGEKCATKSGKDTSTSCTDDRSAARKLGPALHEGKCFTFLPHEKSVAALNESAASINHASGMA